MPKAVSILVSLILSLGSVPADAQVVSAGPITVAAPVIGVAGLAPQPRILSFDGALSIPSMPLMLKPAPTLSSFRPANIQPVAVDATEPVEGDPESFVQIALGEFFPGRKPGETIAVAAKTPKARPEGVPSDDDLNSDMRLSPLTNPEREAAGVKLLLAGGARPETIAVGQGKPIPLDVYDTVILQDAGRARHNLFVVKKGRTDRIVVVGGHHDKVSVGAGTIDNWTGATMTANLYRALQGVETEATFVFILFAREEEGLLGSRAWLDALPNAQRERLDAMVNLDTLGVDGTFSWKNNSDRVLLDAVQEAAARESYDLVEVIFRGGDADSSSFRRRRIPAMTLFGASASVIWDIIHSENDTLAAFSFPHYKNAYLLTLALLKTLDRKPSRNPGLGALWGPGWPGRN